MPSLTRCFFYVRQLGSLLVLAGACAGAAATERSEAGSFGTATLGAEARVIGGDVLVSLHAASAVDGDGKPLPVTAVRLRLDPNPFERGMGVRLTQRPETNSLDLEGGPAGSRVRARFWVDSHRPVVRLQFQSEQPFSQEIFLEPCRESGEGADTVLPARHNRLFVHHRSGDLTLGAAIEAEGAAAIDARTLRGTAPATEQTVSLHYLAVAAQPEDWARQLELKIHHNEAVSLEQAWREHTSSPKAR